MTDKDGQLVQQYSNRIRNGTGQEFTVQSWGRETPEGNWEGWLEFHPTEDDQRIRRTEVIISRPARRGLAHWAARLDEDYLENSFRRAK